MVDAISTYARHLLSFILLLKNYYNISFRNVFAFGILYTNISLIKVEYIKLLLINMAMHFTILIFIPRKLTMHIIKSRKHELSLILPSSTKIYLFGKFRIINEWISVSLKSVQLLVPMLLP